MKMNRTKITVALTGLNNTDNPGPGVPVIRGIRESERDDARIVGLAYENLEPAIYMDRVVDKTYQVPYPSEGSDVLLNRILDIHGRDPIDVLIPNFDAELYAFMRSEKVLEEALVLAPEFPPLLLDVANIRRTMGKTGLAIAAYHKVVEVAPSIAITAPILLH